MKPQFNYSIENPINVARRVTIIGRPLGMPTIDGHNATRIFMVEGTGAVDIRFVRLIKGRFIEVWMHAQCRHRAATGLIDFFLSHPASFLAPVPSPLPQVLRYVEYHLRGPLAWVRAGGTFQMFGCQITVSIANAFRFWGFTPGPQVNIRVFGGGVVIEAGVVRATDCFFYSFRPGIVFRETQFVGADFLVLSGSVFLTGCIFLNMSIFSNSMGGGGYVACFGGNVVITGCLFSYTGAFVCTQGLGYLFMNLGGTMTVTGIEVATTLGMASYFGGGIGMFTGAGVSVATGLIYAAEATLGFGVGLGFQSAVGSGINIRTGVLQSSMGSIGFGAGVGLSTYVGTGAVVFNTISISRSTALLSYYGTSSYFYVGNGIATTANVIGFFSTGAGAGAFGGGDTSVMSESSRGRSYGLGRFDWVGRTKVSVQSIRGPSTISHTYTRTHARTHTYTQLGG